MPDLQIIAQATPTPAFNADCYAQDCQVSASLISQARFFLHIRAIPIFKRQGAIRFRRTSARPAMPRRTRKTSNIEHRTSNIEHRMICPPCVHLDVGRSMLVVRCFPFVIFVAQRGWTLDVLNIVRRLPLKVGDEVTSLKLKTGKGLSLLTSSPTGEFTNEDVYAFAHELEQLHPDNPDKRHRGRNPPAASSLARRAKAPLRHDGGCVKSPSGVGTRRRARHIR